MLSLSRPLRHRPRHSNCSGFRPSLPPFPPLNSLSVDGGLAPGNHLSSSVAGPLGLIVCLDVYVCHFDCRASIHLGDSTLCTVSLLRAGDLVNLFQPSDNCYSLYGVRTSFSLCTDSKTTPVSKNQGQGSGLLPWPFSSWHLDDGSGWHLAGSCKLAGLTAFAFAVLLGIRATWLSVNEPSLFGRFGMYP